MFPSFSRLVYPNTREENHIRFDEQVKQCIALKMKGDGDEEPDSYPIHDYDNSDSNDKAVMIEKSNFEWGLPLILSRKSTPRTSLSVDSMIIAMLQSTSLTTLKYREDTLQPPETTLKHNNCFWDSGKLFLSRSSSSLNGDPVSMRRTPSGMLLPYEEDEDDVVSEGLFWKEVDIVNTAKDIAHAIWNVG